MKHIFIDTNVFLHYKYFEDIDWLVESSSDECKLIIAPITTEEIDKKKRENKYRDKVSRILKRFEELSEQEYPEIRNKVYVEILQRKPTDNIYKENDLNFIEQDHRLIASMILYKIENQIDSIELCSNDTGPRLTAKYFGFKAFKLDESNLLPSDESTQEKKIKQLENEIRTYKNSIPKLQLEFVNSNQFIEINVIEKENISFDVFCSEKMIEIKAQHPLPEFKSKQDSFSGSLLESLSYIAPELDYYKRLKEFYSEYEDWVSELYKFEQTKSRTYELKIILSNTGTQPAVDIDINLHFPDGFELKETANASQLRKSPKPPRKSDGRMDNIYLPNSNFTHRHSLRESTESLNKNSPTIMKTNSYDVIYHRDKIKQGCKEYLDALSIVFLENSEIKGFQVDYKLIADNIPQPVEGKLNVNFKLP